MKTSSIPLKVQKVWGIWDIRICILLSLFLQVVLFSFASYRKRTSKKWVSNLLYAAYFLSNWLIPYILGLISTRLDTSVVNSSILAFWATFLLQHLGGPDNFTSLSLDENEMLWMDLIGLFSHTIAVGLILVRTLPNNTLSVPFSLMFMAGTIKNLELLWSRFVASSKKWESPIARAHVKAPANPGPNYEKLSGAYLAMREAHLPTAQVLVARLPPKEFIKPSPSQDCLGMESDLGHDRQRRPQPDHWRLLQQAHFLYKNFNGFFEGIGGGSNSSGNLSHKQRQFTRDFFLKIATAREAFKLLEIELSFVHEALHTKYGIIHGGFGIILHLVAAGCLLVASCSFFVLDKLEFGKIDIIITYVLIVGAIVLECISYLIVFLTERNLVKLKWLSDEVRTSSTVINLAAAAFINRRRWSETISRFNLISYRINHPRTVSIRERLGFIWRTPLWPSFVYAMQLQQFFSSCHSRRRTRVSLDLARADIKHVKDNIFDELKVKADMAKDVETAAKICAQRGDWALMRSSCYNQLKWSLGEVEHVKSLLLWHIATDLCYYNNHNKSHGGGDGDNQNERCPRFCKTISDYMLCLLLFKREMLAPVVGKSNWVKIYRDTCAEIEQLICKRSLTDYEQACQVIFSMNTEIEPVVLKGDASKSVLFDACRLAKQLFIVKQDQPWELMTRVWVELLAYAAINCEATVHAQQLGQGGELLTYVWLLMNHLGLGNNFFQEPKRTVYKLVVEK